MSQPTGTRHQKQGEAAATAQLKAPAISLPKGGGAVRGMGEKFSANPVTGTASMAVPIFTSDGRSGFAPKLSLSYDSGSGNGVFGFGWDLSLPSITRKTDKGLPLYRDGEESDTFILSGAEDLVPQLKKNALGDWLLQNGKHVLHEEQRVVGSETYEVRRYRPRIEGLFARIERWSKRNDPADVFWRSISRDNITTWYGKSANSRISDPADPSRIFNWLICESYDDKGNAIVYTYKAEDSRDVDLTQANERHRVRTANRYLKRISYGNHAPYLPALAAQTPWPTPPAAGSWYFEVIFDYGEHDAANPRPGDDADWPCRDDPFSSYRSGFEVRTNRLCQRILMFHHFPGESAVGDNCLVRSTDFTYRYEKQMKDPDNPIYSFLLSVTQTGYKRKNANTYLNASLPPLDFEYSRVPTASQLNAQPVESPSAGDLENLPTGLTESYRWVDLDGEGISGILAEQAGAWFYKPNLGSGHFGALQPVSSKPSLAALNQNRQQLLDLAGDGQLDLVDFADPTPGFYERTHDARWESFRPFESLPVIDWDNPNLRFVDLTGDGHADVLISEDSVFTWHLSLAETGFDQAERVQQALDEELGPHLVLADGTESIYLADMSGDGLVDLVRIRNGEVCYWPNLGYSHFGTKVTMDNAPWFDWPELLDQRRVRLADIDGSGTADILYLGQKHIDIYRNESGNSWSLPVKLLYYPPVDNLTDIQVVDLTGNGTACLVWSSPLPGEAAQPLRYIDLMAGKKPHLLVAVKNNLGAETQVDYVSSTKFYLADKAAGKSWITKLPFPMHVVERVITCDHISRNRFVTRYAYHHGFFDGIEREFRGFGMVEQWDTEEFSSLAPIGGKGWGTGWSNLDTSSHVPPVLTRTWFHTGAYLGRNRVSNFLAGLLDDKDTGEYYREPGLSNDEARALLLPDTILPDGLTPDEEREACRTLKGMMLRQEVYAQDGTVEAVHPYTVVEQNFAIRLLQGRGSNRHAIFYPHPREALTYHYERNPQDPRIQHAITLEVDDYGNSLKEATIGYGRRPNQSPLTGEDKTKQEKTLTTYTETGVTNTIDGDDTHRAPLPTEMRTYELTGYTPTGPAKRFQIADFVEPDPGHPDKLVHIFDSNINYEKQPTGGKQRRLIERVRTYYRSNDLTHLLPLGTLESLALPGESYTLAFTPGLLGKVFVREGQPLLPNPATVLGVQGADGGGYVDLDNSGHWWIPSGWVYYSQTPNDTAAQELVEARVHFFLPKRFKDAFGRNTTVIYDDYDLLLLESKDPLGNRITAGERDVNDVITRRALDYRVLQPWLVSDPNRNRRVDAFDALGMVVGTAVMGKPEENFGDSLTGVMADLTEAGILAYLKNPLASAHTILKKATTRLVYDLFAYHRTKDEPQPQAAVVYALARETHESDLAPGEQTEIQHSCSYSDGFGREIQKKIRAEPGPVSQRDANGEIIIGADGQPQESAGDVSPRWVGSGWTIFNNKGKPVRQYEPFFTDTHRFEFEPKIGVSPVLFYDPLDRVVATLHANHTWEKVVLDPWRQETWDVNDTVLINPAQDPDVGAFFQRLLKDDYMPTWNSLRTDPVHAAAFAARYPDSKDRTNEASAAKKAAAHAGTSAVVHFDALRRTFLTVAQNKVVCPGHERDGKKEELHTRVELDIEGNQLADRDAVKKAFDTQGNEVEDPRGRIVMRYDYDIAGPEENEGTQNAIHQASMEAGERWTLFDVAGNPIRAWDSQGFARRMTYDELRRPTGLYVIENGIERLSEKTIYGESQGDTTNHRGQVYRQFDQAGVVTHELYDFKGNLRHTRRQLRLQYKKAIDWKTNQPSGETFSNYTTFDALNRPIMLTAPDNSVTRNTYNEANLLQGVEMALPGATSGGQPDWTPFVTNIDYDAKGQRTRIDYGNGVSSFHKYDTLTFHLVHLLTRRSPITFPNDCPAPPQAGWPGCQVQNLHYSYDPAGNITHIRDDAQQAIFFKNRRVEPSAEYTYDAIYRLIQASGRERLGQNSKPIPHSHDDALRANLPHPGDGNAIGTYVERYVYDEAGNVLKMQHRGGDPVSLGWTRTYAYEETSLIEDGTGGSLRKKSNRLSRTTVGNGNPVIEPYTHDAHGNMTSMPHLAQMAWDFENQLKVMDLSGGGKAYNIYDADGQRVRKVIERQNATIKEERIYLGGSEIYRKYNGNGNSLTLERETLHVMDDQQRIALVERKTVDTNHDPSPVKLTRYQLGNHLGSASVELDENAHVISYEEYSPYGSTVYQAVDKNMNAAAKQYRYTGKERDEESGLNYHGARYYAPWLGRWVSCDLVYKKDLFNFYTYVNDNPVLFIDKNGLDGKAAWISKLTDDLNKEHRRRGIRSKYIGKRFYKYINWYKSKILNLPLSETKKRAFRGLSTKRAKRFLTTNFKVWGCDALVRLSLKKWSQIPGHVKGWGKVPKRSRSETFNITMALREQGWKVYLLDFTLKSNASSKSRRRERQVEKNTKVAIDYVLSRKEILGSGLNVITKEEYYFGMTEKATHNFIGTKKVTLHGQWGVFPGERSSRMVTSKALKTYAKQKTLIIVVPPPSRKEIP